MAGPNRKRKPKPLHVREATQNYIEALKKHEPNCLNDERFTQSRPKPLDTTTRRDLYLKCFHCPIFEACSNYAQAIKPNAGYWAGKNYGTWERK